MTDKEYIYAVARIRSKELLLLSKSDIDQLMNCKSEQECLRLLKDKGWGKSNTEDAQELLSEERNKTWELMKELVEDMSVFHTFLCNNDFHNLKAAIKQIYRSAQIENIYLPNGTIDPDLIYNCIKEHEFAPLPESMRTCGEESLRILLHTGDSQLCDVIIDQAALKEIYRLGKESKNELLAEYSELKVAFSDINIAIRSHKTKKDRAFMERALAECDSLDINRLMDAAIESEEAIYEYLSTTVYVDAVPALKEAFSAFERWCDNLIIRHIRPQKYNPFTLSPLAAYILARENEIKTVRILLSGKRNDIADDIIRERLREMYV